ncbi:MAG: sulfatase [Phycisphaeraceae bacterium]
MPAQGAPPHVLLIMADDLGWKDLHCQGNDALRTPRLDAFAKQGLRFTDAYAASPVCSPTRASIMTGLAPARLHITQHGPDGKQFWPADRKVQPPASDNTLPLERITLAERLREAGYATGFFGKWHLGDKKEFWPLAQGFDVNLGGCGFGGPPTYFDPYRIPTLEPRKTGEYLTDRLADETIAFMRERKNKPMFICLWTYNPHFPFEAPADLIEHYKGKEGPGLKNAIYGAQLEATDRAIGRVLDEVDRLKLAENTLVIFTSDNGGWMGATDNRPLRAGKGYLYEGGLRVPLIIRWPGVTKAGTIEKTPVISMDLTATILEAAGVSLAKDETLDGQSLKPLITGHKLSRDALYFHYPHFAFHKDNRPGSAIRAGNHKLILRYDDESVELYDLAKDESERNNLAGTRPDLAGDLRGKLEAWLKATNAGIPSKRP